MSTANAPLPSAECAALLMAAPASGQGKTTVTAALARTLVRQGKKVCVFKTGPDFIDPMIHQVASNAPVYQLDMWMGGEADCRQRLYQAAQQADVILIEGVMGLFDGEPSSADLARTFGIPILAVIDGQSMAQTFGAIAYGLAHFQTDLPFFGVLANRVSGEGHFEWLAQSLQATTPALGWMQRNPEMSLPERHLGLVQADELHTLDLQLNLMCDALHLTDLNLPTVSFSAPQDVASLQISTQKPLLGHKIAIARDAAFSFLYPANVDFLTQMGAELTFFSPLNDRHLPQADALYFPGGYPELHLNALSKNLPMIEAIRAFHQTRAPILAECGGMMYLCEQITNADNHSAQCVGLLQGTCVMQPRLVNLGLHCATFSQGELRGHTFHYAQLTSNEVAMCETQPARAKRKAESVFYKNGLTASFMHWYFPSNPHAAVQLFLKQEASK